MRRRRDRIVRCVARSRSSTHVLLLALLLATVSCNRAALRIPGAAGSFHVADTGYVGARSLPKHLSVRLPVDVRSQHYGERIAGTSWTACDTEPFQKDPTSVVIVRELSRELEDSKLFSGVSVGDASSESLLLETRIRAFCAQAWGFLFIRAAGISSLEFTIRDGDSVVYHRVIERVVTDADDDYSGKDVTFIEQGMKVLLSDVLRVSLRDLLEDLDSNLPL